MKISKDGKLKSCFERISSFQHASYLKTLTACFLYNKNTLSFPLFFLENTESKEKNPT